MYEPWEVVGPLPTPSFDFSPADVEDPSLPSNSATSDDYFSVSITTKPLPPYHLPYSSSSHLQQSPSSQHDPSTPSCSALALPASYFEQQQHAPPERIITPLGSSFFDVGWERALSLSHEDEETGDVECLVAKTGRSPRIKKVVMFNRDQAGHVILHPSPRPTRPRFSPSAVGPTVDLTPGHFTAIAPLESYPIHDLSSRLSDPTFSSTGLVAESSFQPSSTYPSSSYPPYPQAFTTSTHNPLTPYSHPYPSPDAFLLANPSYNGFRPYQQHQQPHRAQYSFSNRLSLSPIHHPHSSRTFFNTPLAVISDGMSFPSSTSRLHPMQPIAEHSLTHLPPPFSPEPDTSLSLDLVLPLSPVSTSSQASSGAAGGRAASVVSSFGTKRRVPQSLEEMLEDKEIIRLSKRVARGEGCQKDGSAPKWTGVDDAGMRSSFGLTNYPPYPDHLPHSVPAQIVTPSLLQPTFSPTVVPLPSGPSAASFPAHIKHQGSNEPSACSTSTQSSTHPPIEHPLVHPPQQPRHLAVPMPASAQLPQSIHLHLPSSKLLSLPSGFGTWSQTALLHPIPALASATASTSALKPPSPKRTGKHSNWGLPPGAYAALSAPEKKKARNRFASKALRERKKEGQRVLESKLEGRRTVMSEWTELLTATVEEREALEAEVQKPTSEV